MYASAQYGSNETALLKYFQPDGGYLKDHIQPITIEIKIIKREMRTVCVEDRKGNGLENMETPITTITATNSKYMGIKCLMKKCRFAKEWIISILASWRRPISSHDPAHAG